MSTRLIGVLTLSLSLVPLNVFAAEDDQLDPSFVTDLTPYSYTGPSIGGGGVLGRRSTGGLLGIDSIPNWSSYFYFPGFDSFGNTQFSWTYTMVGKAPFGQDSSESTTIIPAPIVPVTMDLRNADGTPRFVNGKPLVSSPAAYVAPTFASPVFQNTSWESSERQTQFTDAVQRAEFFRASDDSWHTMLNPAVKTGRSMILKKGTYRFVLNADGSCCRVILVDANAFANALFPPALGDTTTVMGQAETAKDVRTTDISTFLFPNTFLYLNGDPTKCCIIGYHTYDVEAGDASNGFLERRYVMNYSSWVTSGVFRNPTFADVVPLSHEMSETFNDPFVSNGTPWWLAPNGNCQNNLETGDVIEGLPKAILPVTLKGVTYHVQNEALLQWFAGQTPSSAIGGAYSFPDKTVLTSASTSRNPGCL